MTLTRGCWRLALGAVLLAACDHTDSFTNPDRTQDGPYSAAAPVRLTFNTGEDLTPVVDTTGGTVLYAFDAIDVPGGDQCLALVPLAGGTRTDFCPRSATSRDSVERAEEPAWFDDGSVAYVRGVKGVGQDRDRALQLGTAPLSDPTRFTARLSFPLIAPSGIFEELASHLTPLGSGRLAYMGEVTLYVSCGQGCVLRDSVGREAAIVDMAGTSAPTIVPGTDYLTGLSAGPQPGDLVYTLYGDGRAYLRTAAGAVSVLHDFGTVAREVQYRGGRLAAVVNGDVSLLTSDTGEPFQLDFGGELAVVDIASSTTLLPAPGLVIRRVAISPDGRTFVMQTASKDLYRVEVP